jgi:hypothetical protein
MGNETNKKDNNNEYITFETIQESLGLKNPSLFKKYLEEIYIDLATLKNEQSKSNEKHLSLLTFHDYIKLPIFISEKLFNSFATSNNQEGLSEDEFVNGFFKLYMGTFQETTKVIFNLLDFDKDGIIKKEDVKLTLSYLPLNDVNEENDKKLELVDEVLGYQLKSLEEIDDIVNKTFKKYEDKMKYSQFKDTVQNKKSDVFLQIIFFLYQKKPFSAKNVESLKIKFEEKNDKEYERMVKEYMKKSTKKTTVKITAPNKKSTLSPVQAFFQKKFNIKPLPLNPEEKFENTYSTDNFKYKSVNMMIKTEPCSDPQAILSKSDLLIYDGDNNNENYEIDSNKSFDKNTSIVRLNNDTTLAESYPIKGLNFDAPNYKENIKDIVDKAKKRNFSPSKYLKNKEAINNLALNNKSIDYENNLSFNTDDGKIDVDENEEKNICYENWLYKLIDNSKLKKVYLSLVNKDLFYYKDKAKNNFLGMHNLSGCFVHEHPETITFESRTFYIFEIFFNNKAKIRKFYTPYIEIMKDFVSIIKKAIGYVKFSDFYDLKEVIGKGKFGMVHLGIHKKTQQKVAVKVIKKEKIQTTEDKELVRIEIGILKLCHHPNIVRLLDHLENEDYIFIVLEFIDGDTLHKYFKKRKIVFTEHEAYLIMVQIAKGIKYLHKYGIVHRDLKPENIMITKQNGSDIIKIMDFGLSKIVSSQEKMVEGYGTIHYVSPEVLLRTPYNKEVDIWSLGIILFYMLCGHLPFKGSNQSIVGDKIINEELEFIENEWKNMSKEVKKLIAGCLTKEPEERITIEEFLNHPWIKKNMKQDNT